MRVNGKIKNLFAPIRKVLTNDRIIWLGSPILILIVWEVIARCGLVQSYILPAPSAVFQTLFSLIASGELWPHIYMSMFRALSGFVAGSILGILLGLIMGWSRFANNVADIPFNVMRAVPKAALVPLFIVWFGIGEFPKILLIALSAFILCTINTQAGVRSVDTAYIKAAKALGAKDRDIIREVVIPAAAPMIFAALRLGILVSLVLLVIVEMTAAKEGLGIFITDSQRLFLTAKAFAGIMTLALLGYALDRIVRMVGDRVLRWHKGVAAAGG
jgi:ABC-type nitrate/sulfonate/bicarbonate transport system permease component